MSQDIVKAMNDLYGNVSFSSGGGGGGGSSLAPTSSPRPRSRPANLSGGNSTGNYWGVGRGEIPGTPISDRTSATIGAVTGVAVTAVPVVGLPIAASLAGAATWTFFGR